MVITTKYKKVTHIKNVVFQNISATEYEDMLKCGKAVVKSFDKGSTIFAVGEKTQAFGIVLSGIVYIENVDLWGNRFIIHELKEADIFAETYAFCDERIQVDVKAAESAQILFLNVKELLSNNNYHKSWYNKFLLNFLQLAVHKNLVWSRKMFCISPKGLRARIMNYLSGEVTKQGSCEIVIPFDRQAMADYLHVERSALSKELGKMRKEGLLDFYKNQFSLKQLKNK